MLNSAITWVEVRKATTPNDSWWYWPSPPTISWDQAQIKPVCQPANMPRPDLTTIHGHRKLASSLERQLSARRSNMPHTDLRENHSTAPCRLWPLQHRGYAVGCKTERDHHGTVMSNLTWDVGHSRCAKTELSNLSSLEHRVQTDP